MQLGVNVPVSEWMDGHHIMLAGKRFSKPHIRVDVVKITPATGFGLMTLEFRQDMQRASDLVAHVMQAAVLSQRWLFGIVRGMAGRWFGSGWKMLSSLIA